MSTRSNIALLNSDKTVEMIYCHSDGYPSYNGKILLENYSDTNRVRALLAQGDVSCLAPEIGEKHGFDWMDRPEGVCTFYARDRDEKGVESQTVRSVRAAIMAMEEYLYLWDLRTKTWSFSDHGGPLQPLTEAACKE